MAHRVMSTGVTCSSGFWSSRGAKLVYVLAYLATGVCLVLRDIQGLRSLRPRYIGRPVAVVVNLLLWPVASLYRRELLTDLTVFVALLVVTQVFLWLALTDHLSNPFP